MKKKINKSIAFILSLFVGFSTIPAAYAGIAGENYVDFLEKIKVIDKEMNIAEDATVTRAQFIRMVVNILCNEVSDRETESPFADVGTDNENYKYIRTAYEYGIISGDGNGNFNPNSPIKYNDAIKILVELLGYREYAMMEGGYPGGYLNVATDIKLTKSVTSTDNSLKGQDAARLIYNALDSNTVVRDIHGSSYEMTPSGDKLMTKTMDLYSVKGILTANEFTGLYDVDGAGKNSIVIGGTQINIFNTLDAEKYLGYDVECFYRSDDENDVVMAIVPTAKNNVTEIKADEFYSFLGSEITYIEEGRSKKEQVSLDDNLFVIVNGRIKDDYNADTFVFSEGTITVIDNNGDNKGDVINILSYEDYVISSIDPEDEIIYDIYGKNLDLSIEKKSKSVVISDGEGNQIPFSKLEKNTVLSVVKDESGDYIRAILKDETVTGKIYGIYEENDDIIISIDNKEYKVSADVPEKNLAEYKIGENGEFLIDAFGKIIYFKKGTVESVYGLIINTYYNEDDDRVYIKYIDHNGAIKKRMVSENCRLNGKKIKNPTSLETTLVKKQVVILQIAHNGEIWMIETEDGAVLHAINEKTKATYSGGPRWFGGKLTITDAIPIFVYPSEDTQDEDKYFVAKYDYLAQISIAVQGFNKDKKSYIPEVIAIEKPAGSRLEYSAVNVIVESIGSVLDYDDEVIYLLRGYSFKGTPVSYKIKDKSVIDSNNLSCGDMIKVEGDAKGYIEYIDKFYDGKKGNISSGSKFATAGLTGGFKPSVGYVYEFNGDMLGVSSKEGESDYGDVVYYRLSSAPVITCEVSKRGKVDVSTATSDMLTDYVNNSNPCKVFTYTTDGLLKQIIILK